MAAIFSFGTDGRLRDLMADEVCGKTVLDIGTGTGKSAAAIRRKNPACAIAAVDPSAKMLERATREKSLKNPKALLVQGAGENLPFAPSCFDCAVSAFAIKHGSAKKILAEAFRVLKLGGKLAVMEAQIPGNAARIPFVFYIKTVAPFLASFLGLSGEYKFP